LTKPRSTGFGPANGGTTIVAVSPPWKTSSAGRSREFAREHPSFTTVFGADPCAEALTVAVNEYVRAAAREGPHVAVDRAGNAVVALHAFPGFEVKLTNSTPDGGGSAITGFVGAGVGFDGSSAFGFVIVVV
jgi:hypothetical protein